MNAEPEVIESEVSTAIAIAGDAEIDIQVATARRFPRSIARFMQKAQEMATLTPEIAASCIYALPRKENGKTKNIEGPSARLAEICASAWGNLRAEGKVLGADDDYVTARGTAWDIENNVAIAYEVRRRITDKDGRRYSSDMVGVTGNAGASIALRNAILKVVPTPFWRPIYLACRKVVAGSAETFQSRRKNMLHEFAVMGVTEERLCDALGVRGVLDITLEHMATLGGFYTALKDGETTIEEAFPENGGLHQAPKPAQRKSEQAASTPATPTPAVTPPAEATPAAPKPEAPKYIGLIVDVVVREQGSLIKLDTGLQCATRDEALIRAAQLLKNNHARVELVTRAPKDPKYAPALVEIVPLQDGPGDRG